MASHSLVNKILHRFLVVLCAFIIALTGMIYVMGTQRIENIMQVNSGQFFSALFIATETDKSIENIDRAIKRLAATKGFYQVALVDHSNKIIVSDKSKHKKSLISAIMPSDAGPKELSAMGIFHYPFHYRGKSDTDILLGSLYIQVDKNYYAQGVIKEEIGVIALGFLFSLLMVSALYFYIHKYITTPLTFMAQDITNNVNNDFHQIDINAEGEFSVFVSAYNNKSLKNHQKTIDLIDAKELAEFSKQKKADYLATMSHEIRTPLNGIIGTSNILKKTSLNDKQKSLVRNLVTASNTLLTLINDVLDFSKLENGKLTLQKTNENLIQIFTDVIDTFESKAKEKELTLNFESNINEHTRYWIDSVRLKQILLNLVSNSLKFTREGTITLKAHILDNTLSIAVKDTGIGIPQNAISGLFNAYEQVENDSKRAHEGTGLGLAICKDLVHLMNGEINVESTIGQGTSFNFYISIEEIDPELEISHGEDLMATPSNEDSQTASKFGKILVVDDVTLNVDLAEMMLEDYNYQIFTANSGIEAIEAYKAHKPDVILMDCLMPEMDGYEATKNIRKLERANERVPVVALTAASESDGKDRCLNAGMDDFLSKPYSEEDLVAKIDHWLNDADNNIIDHDELNSPLGRHNHQSKDCRKQHGS